jgi:hypothetical protein
MAVLRALAAAAVAAAASAAGGAAAAQVAAGPDPAYFPYRYPNPAGSAFKTWKFGLFVHWGPISQWGAEISFPLTCRAFPCTVQGPGGAPVTLNNVAQLTAQRTAYAALAQTFNPTAFNASELMDLAAGAGMNYVTWVATHCDGFSNWASTRNSAYSIMATPYGQDTFKAIAAAARARGMGVGAYVCPSFWNDDSYWAPNATTAFGVCCSPNYVPSSAPATWDAFVTYLQGELADIAAKYSPDHYWLDSGTNPPEVDTRLEEVVDALRAANPAAVMQVRDGGVWHDYVESSESSCGDVVVGATGAGRARTRRLTLHPTHPPIPHPYPTPPPPTPSPLRSGPLRGRGRDHSRVLVPAAGRPVGGARDAGRAVGV